MSRSRRKTPIFGNTTSDSERKDKRIWHSRMRHRERQALAKAVAEDSEHLTLLPNQVVNPWAMDKEGKHYWPRRDREELAKELADERAEYSRLMRKWISK